MATKAERRIYDAGGSDWRPIPACRTHAALVRYAIKTIRTCGAYGTAPIVEDADAGRPADVTVASHGEVTLLAIYAADREDHEV